MIRSTQEFQHSREVLANANQRLTELVEHLRGRSTPQEILRLTDPQVSFLMGIHEEAVAYQKDHAADLSQLEMPPSAAELREKLLKEN